MVRFRPFIFSQFIGTFTLCFFFFQIVIVFVLLLVLLLLIFHLLLLPAFYKLVHPYEGVGSICPCLGPGIITTHHNTLN